MATWGDDENASLFYVSSEEEGNMNNSEISCSVSFIIQMCKISKLILNMSFLHKYVSLATEAGQNNKSHGLRYNFHMSHTLSIFHQFLKFSPKTIEMLESVTHRY